MQIFITGGSGLIGSAVVAELLGNGHTVLALARSDSSTTALETAGAKTIRGDLADLRTLRAGAASADGVIHLAFANDFSSPAALAAAVAEESAALAALGEELIDSDRPLVTVSGTPYVPGRASTEADPLPTDGPVGGRSRSVMAVLGLASRGVRSSAVRLPRTVHNEGRGGFAGLLTEMARRSGVSGYPGDGTQRWPAVHALDAAVLFRLALEKAPAGTAWHAVGDQGDAVRDIATVIGQRLRLPVEAMPQEAFGVLGPIFATDQPASSAHTRQALGWEPKHPASAPAGSSPEGCMGHRACCRRNVISSSLTCAGLFLLDPVTAARDDHPAQVGDRLFHGLVVDKLGGGVPPASDEQGGLGDGRRAESSKICPVAVEVAVTVERAGEPSPAELGRVVAEVIRGQPSGKQPGLGDGVEQAGTGGQAAEQAGSKILRGVAGQRDRTSGAGSGSRPARARPPLPLAPEVQRPVEARRGHPAQQRDGRFWWAWLERHAQRRHRRNPIRMKLRAGPRDVGAPVMPHDHWRSSPSQSRTPATSATMLIIA